MAIYQTSYLYQLDENGASSTGKVDAQVPNSAASSTETVDDDIVQVGEQFQVVFADPTTNATFGGTYTYLGHATPFSGFVAEDVNGAYYLFSNDGSIPVGTTLNGFVAEDIAICFHAHTRIATPIGQQAVETLVAGDHVLTADGGIRRVLWIGRQTIVSRFADPLRAYPIRIAAGALAEGVPIRDLLVSPDHALLVEGVLVQAGALVNGTSITRVERPDERFTYCHIELEDHALVLAEGAVAETFVDNVTRRRFDNYAEYKALFGEGRACMPELELPRVKSARQLPRAVRERLGARVDALGFPSETAA